MATDKPRFTITIDDETLARIKAYKFKNHISTQSKAISSLVQSALQELEINSTSEKDNSLYYEDEEEKQRLNLLTDLFYTLNTEGQEKLLDYADDLVSSGKYKKHGQNRMDAKEA